jgi:hypothetical protein
LLLAALAAPGRGGAVEFGADVDFNSRYVWRAIALSEGAVAQPELWLEKDGTAVSAWGNANLKEPGIGHFDEIEWGLRHTWEFGALSVEPAVYYYSYPNREDISDTAEVFLTLTRRLGPCELFLIQDADFYK